MCTNYFSLNYLQFSSWLGPRTLEYHQTITLRQLVKSWARANPASNISKSPNSSALTKTCTESSNLSLGASACWKEQMWPCVVFVIQVIRQWCVRKRRNIKGLQATGISKIPFLEEGWWGYFLWKQEAVQAELCGSVSIWGSLCTRVQVMQPVLSHTKSPRYLLVTDQTFIASTSSLFPWQSGGMIHITGWVQEVQISQTGHGARKPVRGKFFPSPEGQEAEKDMSTEDAIEAFFSCRT